MLINGFSRELAEVNYNLTVNVQWLTIQMINRSNEDTLCVGIADVGFQGSNKCSRLCHRTPAIKRNYRLVRAIDIDGETNVITEEINFEPVVCRSVRWVYNLSNISWLSRASWVCNI